MKRVFKRLASLAACAAVTLALAVGLTACAGAGAAAQVEAEVSPDVQIVIDGSARVFFNVNGQQLYPILYNGTTYLPVRAIGELMGKNVDWNESTKTVTLSGARATPAVSGTVEKDPAAKRVTVELRDDFTIVVDGVTRTFTDANGKRVYPLLCDGSTYLPVRAIGNLMGKSVDWDDAARAVILGAQSLVTDADTFSGQGQAPDGQTADLVSVEAAKAAALAHAGLAESQVTFVQQKLDWEKGRQVYEVEFYTADHNEYDYEIDAQTGAVVAFDYDADHYSPSAQSGTSGLVSESDVRAAALAKVPGATDSHISKCRLDRDDGRYVYELTIRYNGARYEFEIDGATGAILEWGLDD